MGGGGGKGGKSKAPATPDYMGLARETGEQNRKSAEELTAANRPNQYDSRGNSVTWEQANGKWYQTQNVTPELRDAQWRSDWWNNQRSNQASTLLDQYTKNLSPMWSAPGFQEADLSKYDNSNISGKAVSDALYNSVMDRGRKEQSRESESLNTRLRNTGLVPGSEAYNRAMQNLMTSQNDANLLASQNATLAGANEARAQRSANLADRNQLQNENLQNYQADIAGYSANLAGHNSQLQDMNALQSQIQAPYTPTFTGFSGATGYNPTDLMGAANASFGAGMAKTNASNSKKGGLLGAGASLGGSYLGSK